MIIKFKNNLISSTIFITAEEPKKPSDDPEPSAEERKEEKMEEDDDMLDLTEDRQKEKTPDKTDNDQVVNCFIL